MNYKVLTYIGSIVSMGFGLWHLFVPKLWSWYSYIDINAKELILAVRAIKRHTESVARIERLKG